MHFNAIPYLYSLFLRREGPRTATLPPMLNVDSDPAAYLGFSQIKVKLKSHIVTIITPYNTRF